MAAKHRVTVIDGTCVIRLVGEVDFANVDQISDWLATTISKSGCLRIELDLAELAFLDSSGIGCFILASRRAASIGAQLVATNPQPNVSRVLEATGVAAALGLT